MTAPAPAHTSATPTVTGHLDGAAIRFGGEIVEVYPTMAGAIAGRLAAHEALAMLAATLAKAAA